MRRQSVRSRRSFSPQAEQADFEAQEHLADMAQCAVAVALLRELISKGAINVCVGPSRRDVFEGKVVTIQDNRAALAANGVQLVNK